MTDRAHAFIGGALLAVVLVVFVIVQIALAGQRKMVLDPKRASIVSIPIVDDSGGRRVAKFIHECCACGSVHQVAIVIMDDEIEMYWWADDIATRRARWRKGLMTRDPWGAESGGSSIK